MRMQYLSVVAGLFIASNVFAFDVFESTSFDARVLEDDRGLVSHFLRVVEDVDRYSLDATADRVGYSADAVTATLDGTFSHLRGDTFDDLSREQAYVSEEYRNARAYNRSIAHAQIQSLISTWHSDSDENGSIGDIVSSLQQLYCLFHGEGGNYNSSIEGYSFSCGSIDVDYPYAADIQNMRDLINEMMLRSGQLYLDTTTGYRKQTYTLFDFGLCKDFISREKGFGQESVAIKTKPLDDIADLDISSSFHYISDIIDDNLSSYYSFSSIYSNLVTLEDRYSGELADEVYEDSVYNINEVSRDSASGFSSQGVPSFFSSSSAVSAHFARLNQSLDYAVSDLESSTHWQLSSAHKEFLLDDGLDLIRELYNAINTEMAGMEKIGFDVSNKLACQ